ncbi:MAG: hypothetical protein SPK35_04205, partial [Prevotella sp.]|nr:hypothetical protein [Prevotella sp.]
LSLDKIGCTREQKEKLFSLLFRSFALSLDKTGCTRKQKEKLFSLLFRSFALSLQLITLKTLYYGQLEKRIRLTPFECKGHKTSA